MMLPPQPRHEVPNYVGIQLCVQGYAVPKPRSYTCVRKTVSDSTNFAEGFSSSSVRQVSSRDSCNKTIRQNEQHSVDHNSKAEVTDSQVPSSNSKVASTSNSRVATQSAARNPAGQVIKTNQTSLPHSGNDYNRSRSGMTTGVSVVEINCKLPNSNLRVS